MDVDYNPSRKSLIKNKWIATAASIWIQSTAGSLYTFSVYSSLLKSTQGYDQSTLGTVSFFKDLGVNVGILSGLLYSSAGPRAVMLAGAAQCFAGYFLMWLTVTGALPRPPAAVMCLYMLLAAHAMAFFNTASVVTGVHNFPSYGGTIVGIMKGFLGLSGAILIQVYHTIFNNKPELYLLLLALLPTATSLTLMGFVRVYKTNEHDEKTHLNALSIVAVTLAAYLAALIIIQNIFDFTFSVRMTAFAMLIFLLVSPIFIAIGAQREKSYRNVKSLLEQNQISDDRNDLVEHISDAPQDLGAYHEIPDATSNEINLLQAMRTIRFWFLFVTTACAMGSGLAMVNNLSQIGESLGYTSLEVSTLVSLWSIWNFVGRFGAGYISDYFLHARGWPRPLFIVITLGAMCIGHATMAVGFRDALFVGSVLVGVCYGSQWSLMPTIASEVFGRVHLGTIFNAVTVGAPIGSYVLSVMVVGYLYDEEVSGDGGSCIGTRCFRRAFFVMAGVAFIGFVVGLGLLFRTRRFYKNVEYAI